MPACNGLAGHKRVPIFLAEVRNVDNGKRISRFNGQLFAGHHGEQALAGFQNRHGAIQPAQIIDLVRQIIFQAATSASFLVALLVQLERRPRQPSAWRDYLMESEQPPQFLRLVQQAQGQA